MRTRCVNWHRRFEVVPGAQAQVDWGEEGGILAHAGIAKTYSFHMVLSYSRDPFCCYVDSMDLGTFFDRPPAGVRPLRRGPRGAGV